MLVKTRINHLLTPTAPTLGIWVTDGVKDPDLGVPRQLRGSPDFLRLVESCPCLSNPNLLISICPSQPNKSESVKKKKIYISYLILSFFNLYFDQPNTSESFKKLSFFSLYCLLLSQTDYQSDRHKGRRTTVFSNHPKAMVHSESLIS